MSCITGYIEKELKKDELKIPDSDANPKAPAPKEMVDLEVYIVCILETINKNKFTPVLIKCFESYL